MSAGLHNYKRHQYVHPVEDEEIKRLRAECEGRFQKEQNKPKNLQNRPINLPPMIRIQGT